MYQAPILRCKAYAIAKYIIVICPYPKSDFKHAIGYRFLTGIWNIKL